MNPNHDLTTFVPEEVSPPGDSLQEILSARGMTQIELAERIGLDKKTINLIIQGKAVITSETALGLERVLGIPAQFWLNMETQFQIQQARNAQREQASSFKDWASQFPYSEMSKNGWVEETAPKSYGERALNLLRFFGVKDPDCWKAVYQEKDLELAYRKSPKVSEKTHAISAWLREGERKAMDLSLADYDAAKFREALDEIRKSTVLENLQQIETRIQEHCANVGVYFFVVKELPGLGINGVTRWIGGRPFIQQTCRMKWNDQFWFTFFHEAGHVLQNRKKQLFIDATGIESDDKEREDDADRFAANLLIPEADYKKFLIRCADEPDEDQIRIFAKRIGIHPGIIVGRLMREEVLEYGHPAQSLKCKLEI